MSALFLASLFGLIAASQAGVITAGFGHGFLGTSALSAAPVASFAISPTYVAAPAPAIAAPALAAPALAAPALAGPALGAHAVSAPILPAADLSGPSTIALGSLGHLGAGLVAAPSLLGAHGLAAAPLALPAIAGSPLGLVGTTLAGHALPAH